MESGPVEAGVPQEALSDSFIGWAQPLVATGLLVASLVSIRPLGGSGLGLVALVLLVLCAAQAYSRSLPDLWAPTGVRLAAAVAGTICCGLLFGIASTSWGVGWAYVVSGHVGFRFPARVAAALAGLTGAVAVTTLLAGPHLTGDAWPWWTGLTVVPPVITGLARQNRLRTLANAREVVAQTRRAMASEAEAGALAERNRIARELHDVLAHSLSGVSVQLDTADALIESGRLDDGRAAIQQARGLVVDGLVQARDAVRTLREDTVDLATALADSVQGAEHVTVGGPVDRLPTATSRAVLRIVQEALTNARRHAPGARVTVDVVLADRLRIAVVNDAPPSPVSPFELGGQLGMVGLRERVAELGGTVTAGPRTRGGWRVEVDAPVPGSTP